MPSDPKPARTVRDKEAKSAFHRELGKVCVICGSARGISLHHVYGRDDVPANFVALCGDGVRGCHGLITAEDRDARALLGDHIGRHRRDIVRHVEGKIGPARTADWFSRRLFANI